MEQCVRDAPGYAVAPGPSNPQTTTQALPAPLPRFRHQGGLAQRPSGRLPARVEYVANGAQLGWLIAPDAQTVYVYRPDQPAQRLSNANEVDAAPVFDLVLFLTFLNPVWKPL